MDLEYFSLVVNFDIDKKYFFVNILYIRGKCVVVEIILFVELVRDVMNIMSEVLFN